MPERPERRKVLLGVCGSIGVYKSCELVRRLVTRGYEVRVVMTESATRFVSPLTFESLSGRPVVTSLWAADHGASTPGNPVSEIEHISLALWADVLVIAPASAQTIAKLATGQADSALLAIALATKAPLLIAPAMNTNMYDHPQTQENIEKLKSRGAVFVEPEPGDLACGMHGVGRLANPWDLFYHVRRALSSKDLAGKRVIVTTGPTREDLDPVRFISNRSSGKMGVAIAREAFCRGADVTLVHGPVYVRVPSGVKKVPFCSAQELHERMLQLVFPAEGGSPELVVMAAAVADFRPAERSEEKLSKERWGEEIKLTRNPDVLAALGAKRKELGARIAPVLVGFAVETGDLDLLIGRLRDKMESKQVDLMVGNFAQDAFDLATNRVWIMEKNGRYAEVATTFKSRVANKIIDSVLKL